MMLLTRESQRVLRKTVYPHGFNIGVNMGVDAGAGVAEHLHLHIVPRWRADTNFMAVTADTKVIPQALDALCAELTAQWDTRKDSPC